MLFPGIIEEIHAQIDGGMHDADGFALIGLLQRRLRNRVPAAQAQQRNTFRCTSKGSPRNAGATGKSLGGQSLLRELMNGL